MCSNCSGDYENPDETNELIEPPPCQHANRRINLSTAWLACADCGEQLLDLNPFLARGALRVSR